MTTQTPAYILMGRPGAGKGTQARYIEEQVPRAHTVSSGALFRALAEEDSVIGRRIKEDTEKGLLAPDWLAEYFFEKSMIEAPEDVVLIFDGFGRKLSEAQVIDRVFAWFGRPYWVLNLEVSEKVSTERILYRKGVESRADDSHAQQRLQEYEEHTVPALEFFETQGVVHTINGELEVTEVTQHIMDILKQHGTH